MGGLPIWVTNALFFIPLVAAGVLAVLVLARRLSAWVALPALGALTTFAVLVPYRCGMLMSLPPFVRCRPLAGLSWQFQPARGSVWMADPLLALQSAHLVIAVVAAAAVLLGGHRALRAIGKQGGA